METTKQPAQPEPDACIMLQRTQGKWSAKIVAKTPVSLMDLGRARKALRYEHKLYLADLRRKLTMADRQRREEHAKARADAEAEEKARLEAVAEANRKHELTGARSNGKAA